jgi:hypothetical protein
MKKTVMILTVLAVLSLTGWVAAGPMSSPMGPKVQDLDDVTFSSLSNGQILKYNSTTKKWANSSDSGVAGPGFSTDSNFSSFDGTGGDTLKDSGYAPSDFRLKSEYRTFYVPAGAMIATTTSGAAAGSTEYATNDVMEYYFAFDGGATEEHAQFSVVMPTGWDAGTLKVKFIWNSPPGSTAGDTVEWGVRALAVSDNDAVDGSWGTSVTVSDTLLADDGGDNQTTAATSAMTIEGTPSAGDLIFFDIYRNRDGTDDMAEDAWLLGIVVQYCLTSQDTSGW